VNDSFQITVMVPALSGTIILAGVNIGSRAVIGAGSVVTRDVPEGVFAAGNPCRVIRAIAE
jgi:maltose O-acetyltransferase